MARAVEKLDEETLDAVKESLKFRFCKYYFDARVSYVKLMLA